MLMPRVGRGGADAAAALVRILPVLVVALLAAPCWLCFPLLSRDRRASVLDLLAGLSEWSGAASGADRRTASSNRRERTEAAVGESIYPDGLFRDHQPSTGATPPQQGR